MALVLLPWVVLVAGVSLMASPDVWWCFERQNIGTRTSSGQAFVEVAVQESNPLESLSRGPDA